MRHPTRSAINKFNVLLGLTELPEMQDWEIECADSIRVMEFIHCYDENTNSDDEKFTLMALILGSYEEYHTQYGPDAREWGEIKARLRNDLPIHCDHVIYYAFSETVNEEEWFPITKQIRELVPECAQQGTPADPKTAARFPVS